MTTHQAAQALEPCPFCGNDEPEFERMGTPRQSCIVVCGNCGARHESSDEGARSGSSWNDRATQPAPQPEAQALPPEWTPEMSRAVQLYSELGAYAAANLSGAYDLFEEFWRVAIQASRPAEAQAKSEPGAGDARDAARYRWLRDNTDSDWAICEWSTDEADGIGYYRDARAPNIVDEAIDAAIAATQGGGTKA